MHTPVRVSWRDTHTPLPQRKGFSIAKEGLEHVARVVRINHEELIGIDVPEPRQLLMLVIYMSLALLVVARIVYLPHLPPASSLSTTTASIPILLVCVLSICEGSWLRKLDLAVALVMSPVCSTRAGQLHACSSYFAPRTAPSPFAFLCCYVSL
ncbi:hypothetical protein C8Q73DRAFT_180146 [Cubamyces lactineus]|nr:hypothetical protein C8Q73DRAFT_180146 [Cubamyces lactineus]